jgi:hypothetical protein
MSILIDGGMEIWTDPNNLTNWGKNCTLVQEAVNKYSGNWSAKLSGAAWGSISQAITLTAGKVYKFSAWIKADTADAVLQFQDYAIAFGAVVVFAGYSGIYSFISICPYSFTGALILVCYIGNQVGVVYFDAVAVEEIIPVYLHAPKRDFNLSVDRDANAFIPGVVFLGSYNLKTVAGEYLTTVAGEHLLVSEAYTAYLSVLHARPRDYNLGVTL